MPDELSEALRNTNIFIESFANWQNENPGRNPPQALSKQINSWENKNWRADATLFERSYFSRGRQYSGIENRGTESALTSQRRGIGAMRRKRETNKSFADTESFGEAKNKSIIVAIDHHDLNEEINDSVDTLGVSGY